jgi:hypothetical protein
LTKYGDRCQEAGQEVSKQTGNGGSSDDRAGQAMKRTRRAAELVDEAIRVARTREPRAEITGSRWQASTSEVRNWALSAGFELGGDGVVPEQAITAYNQIHPDRPY